jgi:hypothetical protein
MINTKENGIGHSGTAILFVLFFFVVFIFQNHTKNNDVTRLFRFQNSSLQLFAVPSKDIPQLSYLQGFISQFDVTNVNQFREQLRLLTDNKLIFQRIILFQKVGILIKPDILPGFKCHHLVLCFDDEPDLS